MAVFVPAMIVFVHVYEERELEIRFGPSYEQYRAGTPMFLPRLRPR
jgi:protein-S-isoprenylcysteine O-methyltransferase Ste14